MKHAWLLWLGACGTPPGTLQASLKTTSDLIAQVKSLDFSLLASRDASGAVSCAADAADWFSHDVVYHRFVAGSAPHLSDVPAGKNWVVVVTAYASSDGSGEAIGMGCTDGVSVTAGQTHTLVVALDAAR